MSWPYEFFVENAELYEKVLVSLWSAGEQVAQAIDSYLNENGLRGCRVLDAPCGIGRIAVPLATMGYNVVGVDISPRFIEYARRKAEDNKVADKTELIVGDMRRADELLSTDKPFDVVLNYFTSIGYYGEDDDASFLRAARKVSRTGGLLIIETIHREFIALRGVPYGYSDMEDMIILEAREIDHKIPFLKTTWRFYRKQGDDLKHLTSVTSNLRVYSLHELTRLLSSSGWEVEQTYNYLASRMPFSPLLNRLVIIARAV